MYDRLRTFLEVYRQRFMGRAAQALSMTQSAVSHQIASLEHRFGAPLFERSRKGVMSTSVGDSLATELAPLLDGLDQVVWGRLSREDSLSGLIHLGAPVEFFSVFGGRMMGAFAGTKLRAQVHLGGQSFLMKGLEDSSFDICIFASKPKDRTLMVSPVGEETLQLFAHPYLAECSRGRVIDATWLKEKDFVTYNFELSLIRQFFSAVFETTCDKKPTMIVPDLRSVAAICANFPSWTVLSSYIAAPFIEVGKLVSLLSGQSLTNGFNIALKWSSLRTPQVAFAKKQLKAVWNTMDGVI